MNRAPKPFSVRFRSRCALCGLWLELGVLAIFIKQARGAVHLSCAEKLRHCELRR